MLASLLSGPILTALVGKLIAPLENMFTAYLNKQISKEQLAEKLQEALIAGVKDVEAAFLDSITQTYTAFISAAAKNEVMTRAWSIVLYSQLFVLVWHQMVIPALATYGIAYKSSGATVDWAYALVALCLGAPALASRVGPAANWTADALRKVLTK